jgi:hypothetical protein
MAFVIWKCPNRWSKFQKTDVWNYTFQSIKLFFFCFSRTFSLLDVLNSILLYEKKIEMLTCALW